MNWLEDAWHWLLDHLFGPPANPLTASLSYGQAAMGTASGTSTARTKAKADDWGRWASFPRATETTRSPRRTPGPLRPDSASRASGHLES